VKKPRLLIFVLIPVALISCATSVRFDVVHPPIVDLRGVNSITIIPFEENSHRRFEHISAYVTSALTNGIRNNMLRGNMVFVEPQTLANVPQQNFWQYVDVFITGRITDIQHQFSIRQSRRAGVGNEPIITDTVTFTITVYIEYSYIRARDGEVLGTFRKSETVIDTANFARNRHGTGNWNHFDHWNRPRGHGHIPGWHDPWQQNQGRRGRGHFADYFPPRGSRAETLLKSAISRFSRTMDREIAPWVTTEERNLRRRTGNEPMLDEARRLVRMGRYDQALRIYQEIHEQNGNISIGFNKAILLAANEKFTEALELLEALHQGLLVSGQTTPRFIRREIQRMAEFVNGFKLLEGHRATRLEATTSFNAGPAARTLNIPTAPRNEPVDAREIRGTVNLNLVKVYALSEAITYAEDASIWSKIVASTDADALEGRWSMRIPHTAPSLLWFVVADGRYNLFITQTALNTSESIVLDTAQMIRLE